MAAEAVPDVDLGISNVSLDIRTQLVGSVASYGAHLDAIAPAENMPVIMELTPNRSLFMRVLRARGEDMKLRNSDVYRDAGLHTDMADRITGLNRRRDWGEEDAVFSHVKSGHASFVDETPGKGVMSLVFPSTPESLEWFDLVNAAVNDHLDGVVYGRYLGNVARYTPSKQEADLHGKLWTPFKKTSMQPKKSDFEKMGLSEDSPAEKIMSTLNINGIDELTLDTAHIQTFGNPEDMVDKLAPWSNSIHLSLNRRDIKNVMGEIFAERSAQAKDLFIKGESSAVKTREWQFAKRVIANWKLRGHRGRIIYEEKPGYAATNRRVRYVQAAVLSTVAKLYESVPAERA